MQHTKHHDHCWILRSKGKTLRRMYYDFFSLWFLFLGMWIIPEVRPQLLTEYFNVCYVCRLFNWCDAINVPRNQCSSRVRSLHSVLPYPAMEKCHNWSHSSCSVCSWDESLRSLIRRWPPPPCLPTPRRSAPPCLLAEFFHNPEDPSVRPSWSVLWHCRTRQWWWCGECWETYGGQRRRYWEQLGQEEIHPGLVSRQIPDRLVVSHVTKRDRVIFLCIQMSQLQWRHRDYQSFQSSVLICLLLSHGAQCCQATGIPSIEQRVPTPPWANKPDLEKSARPGSPVGSEVTARHAEGRRRGVRIRSSRGEQMSDEN